MLRAGLVGALVTEGPGGVLLRERPGARPAGDTRVDCTDNPEKTEEGKVVTEAWTVCDAGSAVEFVTIADGGHSWPGGRRLSSVLDPLSDALDATPAIWKFFEDHPKQRP